ncbi:MAG: hypothetical protein ACLUNO_07755 [Oscillospiraceae bacterium]
MTPWRRVSPLLFPAVAPDAAARAAGAPGALGARHLGRPAGVVRGGPERGVLRQWALLRALGVACDLALRSGDGGDYQQPTAGKVRGWLAALDLAHCSMRPAACTSCRSGPSQPWRRLRPSAPAWRTRAARCRCCPRRATGGHCPPGGRCALGR